MISSYIDIFIRYIIIGIISAYLIIYGLRPSVPYPEELLELYEHNWILMIIIIINIYILIWDLRIGVLMALSIIALIFDMIIFTK
jgi:hypothetical protein